MSPVAEQLHHVTTYAQIAGEVRSRPDCPKCGDDARIQLLKSMRRHTLTEDWFRCDKCGHLFTRPRSV